MEWTTFVPFITITITTIGTIAAGFYQFGYKFLDGRVSALENKLKESNGAIDRLGDIDDKLDSLKERAKRPAIAMDAAQRAVLILDSMSAQQCLLIVRLAKLTPELADQWQMLESSFGGQRRELAKCAQTLALFGKKKDARASALKQLSEDLGEVDTVSVLNALKQHERELKREMAQALEVLEARLIERQRASR